MTIRTCKNPNCDNTFEGKKGKGYCSEFHNKYYTKHPPGGNVFTTEKKNRDAEILSRFLSGESPMELVVRFNVSRQRISKIIQKTERGREALKERFPGRY